MKQMADGEGEYLPGTFRYNWVGAQNHWQDMANMRITKIESFHTDPA